MTPKPSSRPDSPSYPTREEVVSDPSLLQKQLPKAWPKDEVFGAVAAFAVAANAACTPALAASADDQKAHAVVAPVSDHGKGFASAGCDIVAPPVFLSEEEALKVIKDEAAKRGLNLESAAAVIPGVKVSLPKKTKSEDGSREVRGFKPDLADSKRHVAVEFVSRSEAYYYESPESSQPKIVALRETFEMKQAAKVLSSYVQKNATEQLYFGTFYDPAEFQKDVATTRKKNEEQLRLQVVDFLDWLKAQGAL